MSDACKSCPFRTGSPLVYDADASEALADGCEPSCHARVGLDAIFHFEPPVHRCHGYDAWINGAAGFSEPANVGDAT